MGGKGLGGRTVAWEDVNSLVNDFAGVAGFLPFVPYTIAGSYRRRVETCGDIDLILVPSENDVPRLKTLLKEKFGRLKTKDNLTFTFAGMKISVP